MDKNNFTIDDINLLRDYVRILISKKNSELNGIVQKVGADMDKAYRHNNFYSQLYYLFATAGGNTSSIMLENINSARAMNGNRFAIYNYFDLNTLIAYNQFLGYIINSIESNKMYGGRKYFVKNDLSLNTIDIQKWFRENKFYNPANPISVLKDENGRFAPEATKTKTRFFDRNNEQEVNTLLCKYTGEKNTSKYVKPEKIRIGKNIYTITYQDKMCFDKNHNSLRYIRGVCESKNSKILGYVDISNNIYTGDVYDEKGDILVDKEQSGMDIYENGKKKSITCVERNKDEGLEM